MTRSPAALLLGACLIGCAHRMPATPPVSEPALVELWGAARAHHTDALVVMHRGEVILAWPPVEAQVPIETMSVTKSVVSLGIGRLLDEGHVDSVDLSMATWIPEWADDERADITLRMVLEHTSGLHQDDDNRSIYKSRRALDHAVNSALDTPPGTGFRYNNNATNALAAVFDGAADMRMDRYIAQELFTPLGITDWSWYTDAGDHPHGMSGLRLRAVDLARLGQLVLDEGRVDGAPLLSADWVRRSTRADPDMPWTGWLWWPVYGDHAYVATPELIALWVAEGADAGALDGLAGVRFDTAQDFRAALKERLGPMQVGVLGTTVGPHVHPLERRRQVGAEAQGYLGQYLYVIPDAELVVARQTRGRKGEDTNFVELEALVLALAEALGE